MADGQDDTGKTHEPTQRKLEEARKKGEIPRSADMTTACAYGGLLIAGAALGGQSLVALGNLLRIPLDQATRLAEGVFGGAGLASTGQPVALDLGLGSAAALAPLVVIPAAAALASILGQQILVFAPERLRPKLSKISPLANAKQKFGRGGLFEFAKNSFKMTIYGVILFVYIWAELPGILGTQSLTPGLVTVELGRMVMELIGLVVGVALAIGLIDLIWQRAEHLRKNRMSRKELTDEAKDAEGDPQLKHQRRQRGIDMAMNQMMSDLPTADVVIVNPTHYAVALKWGRARGTAPICVAKGVDEVAARIRELAREHQVPIHSDPPTARALHATVEIGQEIGTEHYKAVAAAIRFADRLRQKARRA